MNTKIMNTKYDNSTIRQIFRMMGVSPKTITARWVEQTITNAAESARTGRSVPFAINLIQKKTSNTIGCHDNWKGDIVLSGIVENSPITGEPHIFVCFGTYYEVYQTMERYITSRIDSLFGMVAALGDDCAADTMVAHVTSWRAQGHYKFLQKFVGDIVNNSEKKDQKQRVVVKKEKEKTNSTTGAENEAE